MGVLFRRSLIQIPRLDETGDLLFASLVVVRFPNFVQGDYFLSAVNHGFDVDLRLGKPVKQVLDLLLVRRDVLVLCRRCFLGRQHHRSQGSLDAALRRLKSQGEEYGHSCDNVKGIE